MLHLNLAALFSTLLALSGKTSAWTPMKDPFNLPFATFPDSNCGITPLPEFSDLSAIDMSKQTYASMRDGICLNQGPGYDIHSFAYGPGKKRPKLRLDGTDKHPPICTLEIYDQVWCGGAPRHYTREENSTLAAQLPGFPIFVIHDMTGRKDSTAAEKIQKCYSLKKLPKKGRSALMTCGYVTSNELPPCHDKRVKDDQAKGLFRACYKRKLDANEGTSDREKWCAPHCGVDGGEDFNVPEHEPGYGPQCKHPAGNCPQPPQ